MNRAQRRNLVKGDIETRVQRIKDAENELRRRLDAADKEIERRMKAIDDAIIQKGKEFASEVIQIEYMPIVRDVLYKDLKANEEKITIFEEKFMERFKKRLEELGAKDEATTQNTEAETTENEGTEG